MVPRGWRLTWRIGLTAFATTVVFLGWLLPGGFPANHARFWSNTIAPLVIAALAIVGVFAAWRGKDRLLRAVLIMTPAGLAAAAVAAWVVFPMSGSGLRLFLLVVATAQMLAVWRTVRGRDASIPLNLAAIVLSASIGVALVFSQRAPDAATRPLNAKLPAIGKRDGTTFPPAMLELDDGTLLSPGAGWITVRERDLSMGISPLLTFESRSPDRCWTSLAPRRERLGPERFLTGWNKSDGEWRIEYQDDDRSLLTVSEEGTGPGAELLIQAHSRLPRPVYSHLNVFCELSIQGHGELSLIFSPCPDSPISVERGPRRIAYVDAARRFRVVQAARGEKGPFRSLAEGTLREAEPLTMTLVDRGRSVARIVLDDWAAQASTQLSPTAGWGLPVNAIEFSLAGGNLASEAHVWYTLAGTSVGRGWDSVGHRAGTYRNRIHVQRVK